MGDKRVLPSSDTSFSSDSRKERPMPLRSMYSFHQRHGDALYTAAQGYDAIVLGAWGCGVFKNDPRDVAAQFQRAPSGDFVGVFRLVHFAVLDHSAGRSLLRSSRHSGADFGRTRAATEAPRKRRTVTPSIRTRDFSHPVHEYQMLADEPQEDHQRPSADPTPGPGAHCLWCPAAAGPCRDLRADVLDRT